MNSLQIELVRSTFSALAPKGDEFAARFYVRLFALDPALRPMFPSSLDEQGQKLTQMLAAAVGMLNRPQQLIPALEGLGRRHAGYGVRDEHYATVGSALLVTLESILGEEFTEEVRDAWTALYEIVSTTMRNAAAVQPMAGVA
jgi:hemoglobin-like flavoprotein